MNPATISICETNQPWFLWLTSVRPSLSLTPHLAQELNLRWVRILGVAAGRTFRLGWTSLASLDHQTCG